jgi:hypothetical protein
VPFARSGQLSDPSTLMRPEPFDKLRTALVEGRFDRLSAHGIPDGRPWLYSRTNWA